MKDPNPNGPKKLVLRTEIYKHQTIFARDITDLASVLVREERHLRPVSFMDPPKNPDN